MGFALIILSVFILLIGIILVASYYTRNGTTNESSTSSTIKEYVSASDYVVESVSPGTRSDKVRSTADSKNPGVLIEAIKSPKIFVVNLDRKPERYVYVSDQLDKAGLTGYQRWSAVDGFNTESDIMISHGVTPNLCERKGLAGCASSHINLWRYIVEKKIEWSLILEDDVHFHPQFQQLFPSYCGKVPKDAKIVYLGYCGINQEELGGDPVVKHKAMCTHAYLISEAGAEDLLNNILPVDNPIDIELSEYFYKIQLEGCYVFNGNTFIEGIRPHDYKESNGRRCNFDGIIYQNQEELGSTIHKIETVY